MPQGSRSQYRVLVEQDVPMPTGDVVSMQDTRALCVRGGKNTTLSFGKCRMATIGSAPPPLPSGEGGDSSVE